MRKKYIVTLTDSEREELEGIIKKRNGKSLPVKRAYILPAADRNGEKNWPDSRISKIYGAGLRTVQRTGQRFAEEGFETSVRGKKQEVFKEKIFDGNIEARLIALRCSESPPGHARWTLRLLSDKMAEPEYAEHISHESVRQILKKMK